MTTTATITRQRVGDQQRINHTAGIFGVHFPMRLEPFVYGITESIAREYNGGYWEFYALSTVARLGGDEFIILLDNPANKDEVSQIASRIVAIINEPMEFRGKTARVGTSIGIAMHPSDGLTPAELMKSADTAMYAAKDAGKNTYRFFKPTMTAHAKGQR